MHLTEADTCKPPLAPRRRLDTGSHFGQHARQRMPVIFKRRFG